MDAQAVVEAALRALVEQDVPTHMAWLSEDVTLEATPNPPAQGKLAYFKAMALLLARGTGARLARYTTTDVRTEPTEPGPRRVRARLEYQVTHDGRPFPVGPTPIAVQEADAWYRVEGGKIVHIQTASRPREWRGRWSRGED